MKKFIHSVNILFLLIFISHSAIAEPAKTGNGTSAEAESPPANTQTGNAPQSAPLGIPLPPPFQSAVTKLLPDNNGYAAQLADGTTIYQKHTILEMYKENGFKPLWTPISILSLSDALSVLGGDGLNPADYRFGKIEPFLQDPSLATQSPEEAATVDILLSEAYLRAMYNLNFGKVDPELLDADHNYAEMRKDKGLVSQHLSWVQQGRIDEAFNWARPKSKRYSLLKSALDRYLKIKANGGWPKIPSGKALKFGKEDERIPQIRQRLYATGDLPTAAGSNVFDELVEFGVKKFQERHNLKADGVIGPSTITAMNVTVQQRINQIRANLDRERWYFPRDVDEYLLVDVADFRVYWMRQGNIYWQSLVQVGKSSTTTPIFRDEIEHIDFNPTWSVPPSIKKLNILPSLQIDSSYLDKKGYELLDDYGNKLDPRDIDWDDTEQMESYVVRQPPGWGNALGKVKFMFPNKHSVFLHDTNQRNYFAKTRRTTSHGCIRLKDPFDFAELLLKNQKGWDRKRIDNLVASNKTTTVKLDKHLPILIQYSTITVSDDKVVFRDDIYRRDPKLISALDKPFKLHLPDLPKHTRVLLRSGVKSASRSSARFLGPEPEIIGNPEHDNFKPMIDARKGVLYFD